jgi:hypothetical protein
MSNELLKYAFVAGELNPSLLGRTDLTKYDLAMAEAYNFFVDYRGGLSSRPGTEFCDFLPDYDEGTGKPLEQIAAPFLFAHKIEAETEYNYMVVVSPCNAAGGHTFNHSKIRFMQNGQYDLETSFAVSVVTHATPAVFTAVGHNFANGDWVKFDSVGANFNIPELANTTFVVRSVSGNTFHLEFVATGLEVKAADFADPGIPQARIARLYTLTCDYRPEHYVDMCWQVVGSNGQGRNASIVRITHPAYPIRNLTWLYDASAGYADQYGKGWTLADEVIGIDTRGPTITSSTASKVGAATVIFAVSAVYDGEIESIRGPSFRIQNIVNYTTEAGSVSIYWTADPAAKYYNVYRSMVGVTEVLSNGSELGFVGRTRGTKFTDPNLIPDFSRPPPTHNNPFAPERVVGTTITNQGTGYGEFTTHLTLTGSVGSGAGFAADGIIEPATGAIVNVQILNQGHNYNFPPTSTLTISGGGAGAAITLIGTDDVGEEFTYPKVNAIYQGRQLYAGTYSRPVSLWGSQIGKFSDFSTTNNVIDSDSFQFDISPENFNYSPIRHLIATQAGLVVMTQDSNWLVNGGGPTTPLTATNQQAVPTDSSGASPLRPLKIGNEILFAEGKGFAVRIMGYSEVSRSFQADDKSILSAHLISSGKEIISWAYQQQPHKIVWSVRADGALLAFTCVKSEEIYAWCSGGTKGQFLATASMREATAKPSLQPSILDIVDSPYFVVQRFVRGRWRRMIERMAQRDFVNLEDAWCVDCGVRNKLTREITSQLYMEKEANGYWKLTNDHIDGFPGFSLIGDVVRGAGGIFVLLNTPTAWWEAEAIEPPKTFIPETEDTQAIAGRNDWSTDTPFTVLRGLWHLEGETVSILADGHVLDDQVVVGGKSHPGCRGVAGAGRPPLHRPRQVPSPHFAGLGD